MLGKLELAEEIEARTGVKKNLAKHVLDAVADIAEEEISAGEDFKIPGVGTVRYSYIAPYKKGEKYVDVFTKEEKVRDKNRLAGIKIRATPEPKLKRIVKSVKLQSKAGKNVVARKRAA